VEKNIHRKKTRQRQGKDVEDRRQELKNSREKKERERDRDLHFCLHLAGIVDSVTSLGGSVG